MGFLVSSGHAGLHIEDLVHAFPAVDHETSELLIKIQLLRLFFFFLREGLIT